MADATPRLPQQLPGSQSSYAPLAATAIAAATFAVLFVALLFVIAVMAVIVGKNVEEPWLLIFPVLTVVLAFIARRQIRASEGALSGENIANASWTAAVVGGALLIAYLFAIQYAVRREAAAAFRLFSEPLTQSKPTDLLDPRLAGAAFYALSPGQQTVVGNPDNAPVMQTTHRDTILRLQASDLGRLIARNPGEVTIEPGTLIKSERRGNSFDSVMAGTVKSPEGVASIAVPLIGESQEGQPRRWHVVPPANGTFFAEGGRQLSPYGWAVEILGQSAKLTAQNVLQLLQQPGMASIVYEGFITMSADPQKVADELTRRLNGTVPRAALVGGSAALVMQPEGMAPAMDALLTDRDGNPHTGSELERFRGLMLTPGRLAPAGTRFKENPDVLPLVLRRDTGIEVLIPIEIVLATTSEQPPIARGEMVLRVGDARAAEVAGELAALKGQPNTPVENPPSAVLDLLRNVPWRLVRIQSDLKPIPMPQAAPKGPNPMQMNPEMMR